MTDPRIIMGDIAGHHNDHELETRRRLLEEATWKRQNIVLIQPADERIPTTCHHAQWDLAFPPNQMVAKLMAIGMEVGHAYSSTLEAVINHPQLREFQYVLTVEQDNAPPRDGVVRLIKAMEAYPQFAAISGLYFCKGEGGCAHIWGDITDMVPNFRPQIPIPNSVQECYGISMGFALWRMEMFRDERLQRPFFRTKAGKEGVGTQDLAFWGDNARKLGYRCAVDTSVKVAHYDVNTGIYW